MSKLRPRRTACARWSSRIRIGITGDFAIIGEPTDCGIEGGCNGTMRFDVIMHGVAAHSARAWMGKNAIHAAAEILNRLNAHENRAIEKWMA